MKSRNRLEIQKSTLKSRNPLWTPEIHFEIQKSTWNPEIHFEIQKSTLKSRNPFWNPKSTWNPVDFEILYAEARRDGPLASVYYIERTEEQKTG